METPITSNNAILNYQNTYIWGLYLVLAYTMLDYNRQASTINQATSINH